MASTTDRKAQLSFFSGEVPEVTSTASKNSLKSIKPFLSVSKVLKGMFLYDSIEKGRIRQLCFKGSYNKDCP